jgi:glyoxylase-like metal-dependent hydrolase (beta-lactamase superfamily II)
MPEAKIFIDNRFKVIQLFTPCLAEMAYVVVSGQEAAIIDPVLENEDYLYIQNKRGLKLRYIFETHFHADFVSGHYDLSIKTGATIVFGPCGRPEFFELKVASDGEVF